MKPHIKNRNDWFLVSVCTQCELVGTDKKNMRRRCPTWINTLLIQAPTLSAAYDKALTLASKGSYRYRTSSGTAYWKVVGICDVLPVYEDIEDGAEIMWDDAGEVAVKAAKASVTTKTKLLNHHRKWLESIRKKKSRH